MVYITNGEVCIPSRYDFIFFLLQVLDEADKMLDYDYETDLLTILQLIPRKRQTALYSATMTTRVCSVPSCV